MKKALVMLLAVVLVIGMAVPAYAVASPVGGETSDTATADLPELVGVADNHQVVLVSAEKAEDLSAQAQEIFLAAQTALKDAAPKGMKTQYFCYCLFVGDDKPQTVTITLKITDVTEVVVKQFVDGQWVELKSALNADGTVTVYGVVEGPIAIFTK